MVPETFVLLMVIVSVKGKEQECSRFHYEEQTLEKIIRQEIRLEAMKTELGETKKQIESVLETFKQEKESFKTEMEEMKKTQNLEKEKLVQELAEMKEKRLFPGIAFQARDVKNPQLNLGETIIFKNTIFDFGNGYNNQTGLYTATKSGLYLFSLQLCLNSGDAYLYYEVFTQERTVFYGRFVAAGKSYPPCLSSQVLTNIHESDTVGVKMTSSSFSPGTDVLYQYFVSHQNVFSGVLINSNV